MFAHFVGWTQLLRNFAHAAGVIGRNVFGKGCAVFKEGIIFKQGVLAIALSRYVFLFVPVLSFKSVRLL